LSPEKFQGIDADLQSIKND